MYTKNTYKCTHIIYTNVYKININVYIKIYINLYIKMHINVYIKVHINVYIKCI